MLNPSLPSGFDQFSGCRSTAPKLLHSAFDEDGDEGPSSDVFELLTESRKHPLLRQCRISINIDAPRPTSPTWHQPPRIMFIDKYPLVILIVRSSSGQIQILEAGRWPTLLQQLQNLITPDTRNGVVLKMEVGIQERIGGIEI